MRSLLLTILLCTCITRTCFTQDAPPVIQWQKCIGGSSADEVRGIIPATDGGFLIYGNTMSTDGDMAVNYGYVDIFLIRIDVAGNIIWRKNYGGSVTEYPASVVATGDGGYIMAASTGSPDGDVTGYHPGPTPGVFDIWVVKMDAGGNIQWQQCYGGQGTEFAFGIFNMPDGGYIISGRVEETGGDVTLLYGGADIWLIKINDAGVLQWERNFGGDKSEGFPAMTKTGDGGFMLVTSTNSSNTGNMSCSPYRSPTWLVKLDIAGNIQWQHCGSSDFAESPASISETADGGYIITGSGRWWGAPVGPTLQERLAYARKIDVNGNEQWVKVMGGDTGQDHFGPVIEDADGNFVILGYTLSNDGDICTNHGLADAWLVKLSGEGQAIWNKTYGGSSAEAMPAIIPAPGGGYLICGSTYSHDGDINGNHSLPAFNDGWLVKLSYPGIPVLPTLQIKADHASICPDQPVTFVATTTLGGSHPTFEWLINGISAGVNNDTLVINTLIHGDVVTCILTSNDPCVTNPVANANSITISVDPSLTPKNFLFADTVICRLGKVDLFVSGTYSSYLWNTGFTDPVLSIRDPGEYWLQVSTNTGCPGRDTVVVALKEGCLRGFFMPTAFTPNGDGKNDILRPIFGGDVLKYKFTVMNRWGQPVFETSDISEGWDGTFKGRKQDGNVFVWTCMYQLFGEEAKFEKGTFMLIR